MPRLSIIIPWAGRDQALEETLVSVLQHRPPDCEILVAHEQAYDDPYGLAGEVAFLHVPGAQSRCELINRALDRARAAVVHLLACGVIAEEYWTATPLLEFRRPEVAAVAPVMCSVTNPRRAVVGLRMDSGGAPRLVASDEPIESEAGRRICATAIGPTWRAGFYRRSAVLAAGGFCDAVGDSLADLDMALSLKQMGFTATVDPGSRVVADPPRLRAPRGRQEGCYHERLFWRSRPSLAARFLWHPLQVAFSMIGGLPHPGAFTQLSGRREARRETARYRDHWLHLQTASVPADGEEVHLSLADAREAAQQQRDSRRGEADQSSRRRRAA